MFAGHGGGADLAQKVILVYALVCEGVLGTDWAFVHSVESQVGKDAFLHSIHVAFFGDSPSLSAECVKEGAGFLVGAGVRTARRVLPSFIANDLSDDGGGKIRAGMRALFAAAPALFLGFLQVASSESVPRRTIYLTSLLAAGMCVCVCVCVCLCGSVCVCVCE